MMRLSVVLCLLSAAASFAAPKPQSPASTTVDASAPQSTVCGDIIAQANTGVNFFLAKDAYDCLTSVPFNAAVATRFINYLNDTLQFQSTLAYLKNPPTSYQQRPVDLIAGLGQIQQDIDNGAFQNQYAFETVIQNLLYAAHDAHINGYFGILAAFSFASPYELASVSTDGVENPKVYISDDLLDPPADGAGWQPSPIARINGQDVTEYLAQFAASNSVGNLEANADWNQLMYSPALDVQNYFTIFGGYTTFYPGEYLSFSFENGTELSQVPWLALYNSPGPTGPLETGGDFYNFFVLGFYPASFDPNATDTTSTSTTSTSSTATPTPTGWDNFAYPAKADVVQPDLAYGGVLTGYFSKDTLTGVLSIPSFEAFGDTVGTFSTTVGEFVKRSKEVGMKKIVIDLQQNSGGDGLLAYDTFKQFFPNIDPFGGSRMRAHSTADVLGTTITNVYDAEPVNSNDYNTLTANEWVSSDKLNAETGRHFSTWGEFFGPGLYNGDYFTTTERYNLSSSIYDIEASGGIVVYGFADRPATSPEPYAANDIVILSDGLCSSACALFMEFMHHEAGVRSVVVGGLPAKGPMQSPSGSRGAAYYTSDRLDANINYAAQINSTASGFLPSRQEDVFITRLGINLLDQIRKGENIPLQFVYEAADCRIFYTPETIYNYTNLWNYAADAIWSKPSLCVEGSTGYATTNKGATDIKGPPNGSASVPIKVSHDVSGIDKIAGTNANNFGPLVSGGLPDGFRVPPISAAGQSKTIYAKSVAAKYQQKQAAFNGICTPGSPVCGGTRRPSRGSKTGPGAARISLAPPP